MKKINLIVIVLSVFLFSAANLNAQTKIAPKITAVRAQLFYDGTGKLSDFLTDEPTLFNTIIGEGGAGGASNSTFVTVEVSGQNLKVGATKIEITVTGNKNRLIQKKLMGVDIYDEHTKFYAPLWLYDTGCEKLKISARLIGAGVAAKPSQKLSHFNAANKRIFTKVATRRSSHLCFL